MSGRFLVRSALVAGALVACEEIMVEPVPVAEITVIPDSAELFVGEGIRISAELRDNTGAGLAGRDVIWSTSDAAVASVDATGLVLGVGSGVTRVTATAEGASASATVVVLRQPRIDLDRDSLPFAYTRGASDLAPARVAITNGGDGLLEGLTTSIDYTMGPAGWMAVELEERRAPTSLTVVPFVGSLDVGEYGAVVWVADAGASNSPARIDVTLRVRENAPVGPSDLQVVEVSAAGVSLAWADNSATEDEFRLERSTGDGAFAALAAVDPNVSTYADTAVQLDTGYGYRVSACNTGGCSEPSNTVLATMPPTPASQLTVAPLSASELRLEWVDNSATETGFRIERRTGIDAFQAVASVGPDVAVYEDAGLQPATSYEYRVVACNDGGCAAPSTPAAATTGDVPPVAPAGLTATTVSTARIDLGWTDASDNETGFRIERSVAGGPFSVVDSVGADLTSYADTGVSSDTRYGYRVRACNGEGCSSPSPTATAVTPPNVPVDVVATAVSDTRIDLAWSDNSATEGSFQVERRVGTAAFAQVAETAPDVTGFTSTGLQPATTYGFRVRACNAGGCSDYSAAATATTLATPPPADPSALTATLAADGSSVALAWTDNATTETGFRVHRSVDGGTFAILDTVPANTTGFTDTALSPDHRYTYRVDACSDAGCSGYTNEAAIETAPLAPSAAAAAVVDTGRIDVSWTDNSVTEDEFRVQRSVGGGAFTALATVGPDVTGFTDTGVTADTEYAYRVAACNTAGCSPFSTSGSVTTPPTAPSGLTAAFDPAGRIDLAWTDNSATETGFRIQRSANGAAFADLATVASGATAFADSLIADDTEYAYRVAACNGGGCSAYSGTAAAATPPTAPSGLAASSFSDTEIRLSWTDNSATETEFRIQRRTGTAAFAQVGTTSADVATFADTGLDPATTYGYRVVACGTAGCSAPSVIASATTGSVPAPSGLTAAVVSAARVDLTWTDNATTETGFQVERSAGGGAFSVLGSVGASVTAYSDTTTAADTEYTYRVAACDGATCESYSNVTSVTTPPNAPAGLTASPVSDTEIALAWTDNSATETELRIQRRTGTASFTQVATVGAGATAFNDTGLQPATAYDYRVLACNAAGCSAPSGIASATTASIPAPSGLTATVVSTSRIDLAWTDNSGTETEFRVERSTDGGATFVALATVGADVTSYPDGAVLGDTEYTYRVAACDASSCSSFATSGSVTTPPTAPSGLTATFDPAGRIDLAWTDNSTTETEFRIQRSAGGAAFVDLATVGPGVTAFTDSLIAADTQYTYRVAACNGGGCSAYSGTAAAATPPTAPSGLVASPLSDTVIALTWTDNSTTETEFRIQRRTGTAAFTQVGTAGAGTTTFNDTGLQPATAYDYQVVACNAAGCSTPSGIASATTASIPAPSGLTATVVSASRIDLAWTDNSGTETEFRVERSTDGGTTFAALTTVGADVTTYSDGAIQGDTEYTYRVAACDASSCSDYSNLATAATPPVAPTNPTAITISDTEIDVAWTDNSATETEFRIERRTGTASFTQVGTVGAGVTAFNDTGLQPATAYDYRVLACNAAGCSAPSAVASATTALIPAPSGLTATVVSASQIDLAWTDNSATETEFRVERSTDGGATFVALATVGADVTTYPDGAVLGDTEYTYRVAACDASSCSDYSNLATAATPPVAPTNAVATTISDTEIDVSWTDNSATETEFRVERRIRGGFSVVGTVGTDSTTFHDSGLAPATDYDYRISACNAAGCSGTTSPAYATTDSIPAPTGVTATAVAAGQVDLAWTDNSQAETELRIERAADGGAFTALATVGANVVAYSDATTSEGTAYAYRVQACDTVTCSVFSAQATTATPPLAPSGLAATTDSDTQITVTWTDGSGVEDEYRLEWRPAGGTFTVVSLPANTTSEVRTGLTPGTTYEYRVRACLAGVCSPYSATASATTSAAP